MKIQIREMDASLDEALRIQVERHLSVALGRFGPQIARVQVRISDIVLDTDKGKRCQIDVSLRPRRVHVDDSAPDVLAAVDRATVRVCRVVGRALERELSPPWDRDRSPNGPGT